MHKTSTGWVFREWAPNATRIFLIGEFSGWNEDSRFELSRIDESGNWEIKLPIGVLSHLDLYKLRVHWQGGMGDRIPSYANYVVQDETTKIFCAKIWAPESPYEFRHASPISKKAPIIYEAHIGMGQMEGKVGSYLEFKEHVLPRVVRGGYNVLQLMAVQEHPYYGSFGYQVSNFFASSSRFGTPEELKELIDEAHKHGLKVIMDIVHSHAVKNEIEGLSRFDGTTYQYFHEGGRGYHSAWDTRCFHYEKPQVLHFLLSNCKYWLEEFHFDGFRFDGVTSMIYHHRGLGKAFGGYEDYFNDEVDEGSLVYLALANKLIHQIKGNAITIAEDMSGMPGMGVAIESGGLGFNYRLAMGIPDYWIKLLKEQKDEDWRMDSIWYELTNRRSDENTICYAESHDQALVGDKTIIFRLIDKDMYDHMGINNRNITIDRGLALHKMIRLVTIATGRGGYLNFMGNEFGHPEWIDFPREGNNWSYHYARRQWNLVDDENLCYKFLGEFDREMIKLVSAFDLLNTPDPTLQVIHVDDQVLGFKRSGLIFIFNFHPEKSYSDYMFDAPKGKYMQVLSTDNTNFGGFERVFDEQVHYTIEFKGTDGPYSKLSLYLPARTAIVLKAVKEITGG